MDRSVVLPTYNERDNLAPLCAGIADAARGIAHEVRRVGDRGAAAASALRLHAHRTQSPAKTATYPNEAPAFVIWIRSNVRFVSVHGDSAG